MRDAKADKFAKHKAEVKTKSEKDQAEFDLSNAEKMLEGVSEEEKADYGATHTDYSESVDALERAIISMAKLSRLKALPCLQADEKLQSVMYCCACALNVEVVKFKQAHSC